MALWETCLIHPAGLVLAVLWCTVWLYCYVTCGQCKSRARLDGKTVIVTGCTAAVNDVAGLGEATAMDLAKRGARLIMACRSLEKAEAVQKHIIDVTKNENIVVKRLDVSLLSSVRTFAEEINRSENRLDVLIHNAGTGLHTDITEEGFNAVWATNHFGPFLLTNLLIDLLKRTKKSRIIFVSSHLHFIGDVDLSNPNPIKDNSYLPMFYSNSKFANVLITKELSRRLKGSEVTVNCLHPGVIETSLSHHGPMFWKYIIILTRPLQKTLEQGAQTTIYLAVSDEVEGVSGKYFSDCKELSSSKKTYDKDRAGKFWSLSEEIVELNSTKSSKTGLQNLTS